MNKPKYFVGIDIASETFTAAAGTDPWRLKVKPQQFENTLDGFPQFLSWLQQNGLDREQTVLCMEATGVYGEALTYYMDTQGYRLAVEPPLKVKRAFNPFGPKSDPVDSKQIAEYACRFWDELHLWQPKKEIIEQIKTLLATREQFTAQSTAHKNAIIALKRKVIRTPLAEKIHRDAIDQIEKHKKTIDEEIRRLIDQDPGLGQTLGLLMSIPGVGFLLAAHFMVICDSAPKPLNYKQVTSFVGICAHEHSSGSSQYPYATSRHFGPPGIRKLLYLAAMSLKTHQIQYRHYFERKVAQGKPKMLVLNNIANKLIKIMCSVEKSKTPYISGYRSVHPMYFKKALTMSSYSR